MSAPRENTPVGVTDLQPRGAGWPVAALAVAVILTYLLHVSWYWPQINDDAFITFRYSRNLADGLGPYFNAGERVEGYTNFLLMVLMAGVIRLWGPDEVLFAAKAVGVAGGLAAIVAAAGLTRTWLGTMTMPEASAAALGWLAAGLVATNSAFALQSTTGLETTLFSGLVMLGLWLDARARHSRRWQGAGLMFALAALTRPEGAAVFAAAWAGALLTGEWRQAAGVRRLALDAGIVGVVVCGHLALRMALYDGELVPNTYYAKTGGWSAPAKYLGMFAWYHLAGATPLLALLPLLAREGSVRRGVRPALLVSLYSIAGVFATGGDWMPGSRLLVPFLPVWCALVTVGVAAACERLLGLNGIAGGACEKRISPRQEHERAWWPASIAAMVACSALIAFLAFWQATTTREYYVHVLTRAHGYLNGHLALAQYLHERSSPGQTVALMDIGIVGYHCHDLHVLDITGLTDRFIAKSPGGFLNKQFEPSYVLDQRPEYVVIVFTAPLRLDQLDDVTRLVRWTDIEDRILNDPLFIERYVRVRPDDPSRPPLERLARMLGAEMAFEHLHPGDRLYLLVLYRSEDAVAVRDINQVFRALRFGLPGVCPVCQETHDAALRHPAAP
ncbi:MAG: hypothetical protein LC135_06235 [Phycisphaerae bacterium]|nr:hypothetical protein [Phycisphaerae bacterium]